MSPDMVRYDEIVRGHVDRDGNLHLYRRGWLFDRQAVFHPAGEWASFTIMPAGLAMVVLTGR